MPGMTIPQPRPRVLYALMLILHSGHSRSCLSLAHWVDRVLASKKALGHSLGAVSVSVVRLLLAAYSRMAFSTRVEVQARCPPFQDVYSAACGFRAEFRQILFTAAKGGSARKSRARSPRAAIDPVSQTIICSSDLVHVLDIAGCM